MKFIRSFKKLGFDEKITVALVGFAVWLCLLLTFVVFVDVATDVIKLTNQEAVK